LLAEFKPPASAAGVEEILAPYIEKRTVEGGAAPVS